MINQRQAVHAFVSRVDGKEPKKWYMKIFVKPGLHSVEMKYREYDIISVQAIAVEFNALAGHQYQFTALAEPRVAGSPGGMYIKWHIWISDMSTGKIVAGEEYTEEDFARAPRPRPTPLSSTESSETVYADGRFVDRGDGTVLDTKTGLLWQKGDSGRTIDAWRVRKYLKKTLNAEKLGGRDNWRAPSRPDFFSLELPLYDGVPLPFEGILDSSYWWFGRRGIRGAGFYWDRSTAEVAAQSGAYRVRAVSGELKQE